MMTMKAIPIGELDRRNPTERWLDDLLKRYATPDFKTFDVFASTTELLEAYLAVVRRRNKIYRWSRIGDVYELEAQALAYISVKTQNKIIQGINVALGHLGGQRPEKAEAALQALKNNLPALARGDQKNIATTNRIPSVFKKLISELYEDDLSITSPKVINELWSMRGGGVVVSIDDAHVQIDETPLNSKVRKIKTYKLSGISVTLSRIKNPKK